MKRILVALDLADNKMQPLEKAVELSRSLGATLHILHVTFVPFVSGDDTTIQSRMNDIKSQLEEAARRITYEQPFRTHIKNRGRVHDAVHQLAGQLEVDLIIAGQSRRPTDMPKTLLTTSEFIAAHARRPVLLVGRRKHTPYENALIDCRDSIISRNQLEQVTPILRGVNCTLVFGQGPNASRVGLLFLLKAKRQTFRKRRLIRELQHFQDTSPGGGKPGGTITERTDRNPLITPGGTAPDLIVNLLAGGPATSPAFSQVIRTLIQKHETDFLLLHTV